MKKAIFLFFAVAVLTSCNNKPVVDSNTGEEEVEMFTHDQANYYNNQLSFRFDKLIEIQKKNGLDVDSVAQGFPVQIDAKTVIILVRTKTTGSIAITTISKNDADAVNPTFLYYKADTSAVFYPYPAAGAIPKKFVFFYSEINTLMDLYEAQNSAQMGYGIPVY